MTPFNNVTEIGRLTIDPEITFTVNNKARASFTVAVRRSFKNSNGEYDSDFIRCEAWGAVANLLSKYFHKGDEILVNGEWRTGNFTGKDGNKIYTNVLNVNKVVFGDKKDSAEQPPSVSIKELDLGEYEEIANFDTPF